MEGLLPMNATINLPWEKRAALITVSRARLVDRTRPILSGERNVSNTDIRVAWEALESNLWGQWPFYLTVPESMEKNPGKACYIRAITDGERENMKWTILSWGKALERVGFTAVYGEAVAGIIADHLMKLSTPPSNTGYVVEKSFDNAVIHGWYSEKVADGEEPVGFGRLWGTMATCMEDCEGVIYGEPDTGCVTVWERSPRRMVARAVISAKTGAYPRLYLRGESRYADGTALGMNEQRAIIDLLEREGHTLDLFALDGHRLPLVWESEGERFYAPYVDGKAAACEPPEEGDEFITLQVNASMFLRAPDGVYSCNSRMTCDCCGGRYSEDDGHTIDCGDWYCDDCFNERYTSCALCECEFHIEDTRDVRNVGSCCESCIDNGDYVYADDIDQWADMGDCTPSADEDYWYFWPSRSCHTLAYNNDGDRVVCSNDEATYETEDGNHYLEDAERAWESDGYTLYNGRLVPEGYAEDIENARVKLLSAFNQDKPALEYTPILTLAQFGMEAE